MPDHCLVPGVNSSRGSRACPTKADEQPLIFPMAYDPEGPAWQRALPTAVPQHSKRNYMIAEHAHRTEQVRNGLLLQVS